MYVKKLAEKTAWNRAVLYEEKLFLKAKNKTKTSQKAHWLKTLKHKAN